LPGLESNEKYIWVPFLDPEVIKILSLSELFCFTQPCISGSLLFDPEDIRKLSIRAIWNFDKGTGLLLLGAEHGAQRACLKAYVHRARKGSNPNTTHTQTVSKPYYTVLNYTHLTKT